MAGKGVSIVGSLFEAVGAMIYGVQRAFLSWAS
jgi:hypothetical protein